LPPTRLWSPNQSKYIIFWLLSTCFLIWLIIMVGGATRLTHSGLSIVEWKPITGVIPPLTQAQWWEAFQSYQKFPEYQLVNQGMSISDFKFIYLMEYGHRLLGRLIGLWFGLPLLFFWRQGYLSALLKKRAVLALLLGLAQGFLGWYMVKSGLVKNPMVSPYRLTAHLGLALGLFGLLFWTALEIIYSPFQNSSRPTGNCGIPIRQLSLFSTPLVIITMLYGGLVAGLKAGWIYNTFPLMEGQLIPNEWNFYKPLWINFLENAALVQWIHRWLAMGTVGLILYTCWSIVVHSTQMNLRIGAFIFACTALLQLTLGIFTLLYQVPVALGTLHQGTAVIVLGCALYLLYLSKEAKNLPNFRLGTATELV